MGKYEKILFVLLFVGICVQVIHVGDEKALGFAFLWLILWILTASYGIAGFWVLKGRTLNWPPLAVVAGIAMASSLFLFPFMILNLTNDWSYYLHAINAVFCLSIGVYLWVERRNKINLKPEIAIFIRSSIVLVFTSVFVYTPIEWKPFRTVLMVLSRGVETAQNNFLVYDYEELFRKSMDEGDCEAAIDFALKARTAGRAWLKIPFNEKTQAEFEIEKWLKSGSFKTDISLTQTDSSHLYTDEDNLNHMRSIGTYLYEAYECKADKEYEAGRYDSALLYYSVGHHYLNGYGRLWDNWMGENAWWARKMAFCYTELKQHAKADSMYTQAIDVYSGIEEDKKDYYMGLLISSYAQSLKNQSRYSKSNLHYKKALGHFAMDSASEKNRREIKRTFLKMASNYLGSDSLQLAFRMAIKATNVKVEPGDGLNCLARRYIGRCNLRAYNFKKAESDFGEALACYKNSDDKGDIPYCQLDLAQVQITLAKYKEARAVLNEGKQSVSDAEDLGAFLEESASLYSLTSDYTLAENELREAIRLYENEMGKSAYQLVPVLASLAHLAIQLDRPAEAKLHIDRANALARTDGDYHSTYYMELRNTTGYVQYSQGNYAAADTSYIFLMKDLIQSKKEQGPIMAGVLDGLGLLALSRSNYAKADSLFGRSIRINGSLFTENHPVTAHVMLHQAQVFLKQGRLSEAESLLAKADAVNLKFLDPANDAFGNLLMAYDELAVLKKEEARAKEYFQKALVLFENKFGAQHWKTRKAIMKARI